VALALGIVFVGATVVVLGILADKAGATSAAGGVVTSQTPSKGTGTYTNPIPGAQSGRIDQGVDYTLSSSGFLAPGKSKVLIANQSDRGWDGGGYLALQLLTGPLAGAVYYVAEGVRPIVHVGQIVDAGQQLVTRSYNPYNGILGNIEAGWATPGNPGQPLSQSQGAYSGDQSQTGLTAGYSFSRFVSSLGGVAGEFQGAGAAIENTITGLFRGGKPNWVPF
jgi:biotin carboxyl carrier protein